MLTQDKTMQNYTPTQDFFNKRKYKKSAELLQDIPFEKRNRSRYIFASGISFLCNILSIATGASFLFDFFSDTFDQLYLNIFLTLLFLISMEYVLRELSSSFFRGILLKTRFLLKLLLVITLLLISVGFSWRGSYQVTEIITKEIPYIPPTLIDLNKVEEKHQEGITLAKKLYEDYNNSITRRGRKPRSWELPTLSQYGKDIIQLQDKRDMEVRQSKQENEITIAKAKDEHEALLMDRDNSVKTKGGNLVYVALSCQISFLFAMFFIQYYHIQSAKQYINSIPSASKPVSKHDIDSLVTSLNTVNHNGRQLTLRDVNNRISEYSRRVNKYKEENKQEKVESNQKTIQYWEGKKEEILSR